MSDLSRNLARDRERPIGTLALRVMVPVAQELAKTALLLALLLLTLWGLLEVFRGGTAGAWYERLWRTVAEAGTDRDGVAIAPRFLPAAARSVGIVCLAAALLGSASLAIGYIMATRPAVSVLRLPLVALSAVPAFMLPFLGAPIDSAWLWPAACLALGDLNAAAMVAHAYDRIRHELGRPYVRTAETQGLSPWSDLGPRAFLITLEGLRSRIPHLLGGTVAIELVYNIHGLGYMALAAVMRERPDYNMLVWIAGLGIVASRVLSLAHRWARQWLTPERGRVASFAPAPIAALWRGAAGRPAAVARRRDDAIWPTPNPPGAEPVRLPSHWDRTKTRLRAYWQTCRPNRVKVALAVITISAACLLIGVAAWGGGYTLLETAPPGLPPSASHPLGTNENGEDVLTTIALGGRELAVPLAIGLATAIVLGGVLGTVSGLGLGSALDHGMDLYAELWESVPKLIVVLAAITYMSYDDYSLKLYWVMGLAFAPLVYRTVRDEVGSLRTSLFLEAAVTLGVKRSRLFWVHVFRYHVLPVLSCQGAALIGYLLLYDAILGFCGVRQRGEVFTWGNLLGTGLDDFERMRDAGLPANAGVVWGPFLAVSLAIAASAVLGDALKALGRTSRFSH